MNNLGRVKFGLHEPDPTRLPGLPKVLLLHYPNIAVRKQTIRSPPPPDIMLYILDKCKSNISNELHHPHSALLTNTMSYLSPTTDRLACVTLFTPIETSNRQWQASSFSYSAPLLVKWFKKRLQRVDEKMYNSAMAATLLSYTFMELIFIVRKHMGISLYWP